MVAYKDGTAVRLVSRAGKDHARRFAEVAATIRALPPATLILDGEVAIFDDRLISCFEWFSKRPEDVASTPSIYHGAAAAIVLAPRGGLRAESAGPPVD